MFDLNLAGMVSCGHVAPQIGTPVFQPEDASRGIGRNVLGERHDDGRAFVLKDFDSLKAVAVRSVVKAALNAIIGFGFANL